MTYAYDIILNFHKKYYNFFEWNSKDIVFNYKKIPVLKISNLDYNKLKYNDVILNQDILIKLKDKSVMYVPNKNNYIMFIVSNLKETMGVMFNEEGLLLKRSGLLFEESEEIEELISGIETTKLTFKKDKKVYYNNISRLKEKRKKYIKNYLNSISNNNILKYLYFDIYQKELTNNDDIKKTLLKENNNNLIDKLYNTITIFNKQKN